MLSIWGLTSLPVFKNGFYIHFVKRFALLLLFQRVFKPKAYLQSVLFTQFINQKASLNGVICTLLPWQNVFLQLQSYKRLRATIDEFGCTNSR